MEGWLIIVSAHKRTGKTPKWERYITYAAKECLQRNTLINQWPKVWNPDDF